MNVTNSALKNLQKLLEIRVNSGGFDKILSQVQLISGGGGNCTAKLKVAKEHQNVQGSLHGGLTATLVDSISTLALLSNEKAIPGTSVDLKVSFMRPVKLSDTILIEAETVKIGRTLAYLAVKMTNEDTGKLVATGEHIKYVGG